MIFGTAQLFGLADAARSRALLDEAYRTGIRAFDTAPSYGRGESEPALARFAAAHHDIACVSTKVGIEPASPESTKRRLAKLATRSLPPAVRDRLRRVAPPATNSSFEPSRVRASVELSLARFGTGRIDRLLLHEVKPTDLTQELLELLGEYLANGDVGQVGVATANALTTRCLASAPALFTVAHVSVGILDTPVELPAHVVVRVGHGLLGNAGAQAAALRKALDRDRDLETAWREAVAGTPWSGPDGLTSALLARSGSVGVTDIIVATTRPERVDDLKNAVEAPAVLPAPISEVLSRLAARVNG